MENQDLISAIDSAVKATADQSSRDQAYLSEVRSVLHSAAEGLLTETAPRMPAEEKAMVASQLAAASMNTITATCRKSVASTLAAEKGFAVSEDSIPDSVVVALLQHDSFNPIPDAIGHMAVGIGKAVESAQRKAR